MNEPTIGVWAQDTEGVWHMAVNTYPVNASTACGRYVEAHLFSTAPLDEGELRPVFCRECEEAFAQRRANERFERLAAQFYRETGIMAPGKDVPAAMGTRWTDEERWAAWDKWNSERSAP